MIRQRLYIAVFVSAILHLAVFTFWWHGHDAVIVSSTTHGSPLNISIRQPATQKSETKPSPVTHSAKQTNPAVKPKPEIVSQTETAELKTVDFQTTDETTKKEQHQSEQFAYDQKKEFALLNNHMIDYLSTEFKVRFKYPALARKRGWQGKVLLWLEVNKQGEISNIVIKRSSGYKILDRNAVKTFELIAITSPKLRTELETKLAENHRLSIPVIYKLTGS